MRITSLVVSFAALVLAAPASVQYDDPNETIIPHRWIVSLRTGASDSNLAATVRDVTQILSTPPHHTYSLPSWKGFAITAQDDIITLLRSLPFIETISPDVTVVAFETISQAAAPYGLARISHRGLGPSNYLYDSSAGAGTFAYIIDTGINIKHHEFQGRATWGANFAEDDIDEDGNGHGTHVAGTTGAFTFGVAKKTNLIAVKVLDSDGAGALSNVIKGVEWAVHDALTKNRINKSVANLSLGGIINPMINSVVAAAVDAGLFVAVAAGNSGLPTITSSPASEPKVCTVGASDENNARASFSNFGLLVDVFAPGVNITSTWIRSDKDSNTISGTSMASPHVAGLGAYLIGLGAEGGGALCDNIKALATPRGVGGLFAGLSGGRLAYNGILP